VPERSTFDYAIVRVVPRPERHEFVNAGVIVSCHLRRYLAAKIELDVARLLALAPDVDLGTISRHLAAIPLICAGGPDAGPLGALSQRERWHFLVAPRSTILQVSPPHVGLCEDLEVVLEHLMDEMVRVGGPRAGP
jgi:hypothetical protein